MNAISNTPVSTKRILLICGIVSSILYASVDILVSITWEDYSYTDQTFSELFSIEAPTRLFMICAIAIPYNLLVIAFAFGVYLSRPDRAVSFLSVLLVGHAVAGMTGSLVFPMHARGYGAMTFTDKMHITITAAEVIFMLLAIGFGAAAFKGWFRLYSVLSIVLLILGGAGAGMSGKRLSEGLPTPLMGVIERMNIYAFMLWIIVLAAMLLNSKTAFDKDQKRS